MPGRDRDETKDYGGKEPNRDRIGERTIDLVATVSVALITILAGAGVVVLTALGQPAPPALQAVAWVGLGVLAGIIRAVPGR